jgi:integrase
MKSRLSKDSVENAQPQVARYTIWDTDLAGFGLRVEPSGVKSFVVKYRADGGGRKAAQRFVSLGRFPKLKVPEARAEARKKLAEAQLGKDPAGELAARRRELTIKELIDLYEEEGLYVQRGARIGTPMKALTAQYTMARLRNHVVPLIGKRRVSELNEGDIEAFARAVAAGKTAKDEKKGARQRVIVKGGDGAARKVVRDLSAVFAFGIRRRIVSTNPVAAAGVRKTDNKRERFLSLAEVQRLGKALDDLESGARGVDKRGDPLPAINKKGVDIARLWALTGARRNEIAGLRWSEVDLERGLLVFEDSKTGRSVRPIGAAAIALLDALRAEADKKVPWVFPAERGSGFYQGTKRVWPEAINRAALPGVTPHTLRHTLGSAAASAGEALLMVGSLLGHSNARSTAIYAHVAHDPARLAADRVTAPLAAALGRPVPENPETPDAANAA